MNANNFIALRDLCVECVERPTLRAMKSFTVAIGDDLDAALIAQIQTYLMVPLQSTLSQYATLTDE